MIPRPATKQRVRPQRATSTPGVSGPSPPTGEQKLWSLIGFAALPFAALTASHYGNAVQGELWGSAPATCRLRFAGSGNASEVRRRHRDVEQALNDGLVLPSETEEAENPGAAAAEYAAAVRRLINKVRNHRAPALLATENANYGFSRNLYGLKRIDLMVALGVFVISLVAAAGLGTWRGPTTALPFLLPTLVSVAAIVGWRVVTPTWVRRSADADADRLMEAAQLLAAA